MSKCTQTGLHNLVKITSRKFDLNNQSFDWSWIQLITSNTISTSDRISLMYTNKD